MNSDDEAQVINPDYYEIDEPRINSLDQQSYQSDNNDNQGQLERKGTNLIGQLLGGAENNEIDAEPQQNLQDEENNDNEQDGENHSKMQDKEINNEEEEDDKSIADNEEEDINNDQNDENNDNNQEDETNGNEQNEENKKDDQEINKDDNENIDEQEMKPDNNPIDEARSSLIGTLVDGGDEKNDEELNKENDDNNQNESLMASDNNENNNEENENQAIKSNSERVDKENNDDKVNEQNEHDGEGKESNENDNKKRKKNLGKITAGLADKLIEDDEEEHQTAEDIHTKSSNDEDDNIEESDNEKEENDDEKKGNGDEKNESDNEKEEADNEGSDNDKNDLSDDFDETADNEELSVMITETSQNLIRPPKEPKENTARRKTFVQYQPEYSDEEIVDQINIMMKDKKLPDKSYHQPIRNYVSRGQLEASQQQDYKKAELLESYLDMLTELLNQVDNSQQEEQRRRTVEEKIEKVNQNHQEFVDRWNNERNEKLREQDEVRQRMEERQNLEISDFQSRCCEQTFIQKYNKPSQSLINLRKAENQMAMAKLFDRATFLKKKADELQQIEQAEAQNKMTDDVRVQYQLIEERHQRERECYEQHNQSVLDTLDIKRDKEQKAYELALAMLQAQLDPPQNKDLSESIKPQPTKRPIRNNTKLTKVKTPAALDIQTIDFSKFTKQRKIIKPVQSKTNTMARKRVK